MAPDSTFGGATEYCDRAARDVLRKAGVGGPPVDAVTVARAVGLTVTADDRQSGRARLVRLKGRGPADGGSILVRREPRLERMQWAVAHEIGESLAGEVFDRIGWLPGEWGDAAREQVANLLASRLLLPTEWLRDDAQRASWDLWELKHRYSTASHELIARRMLDFETPAIVTVFDQGRITWRRSNLPGRMPALSQPERQCLECAAKSGMLTRIASDEAIIRAWPVHEPDWRREIMLTELKEAVDWV